MQREGEGARPVKPVCLIVTGGTFDKEYNELKGELFFRETHLQELLTLGRCRLPVRIQHLFMMDSLEMTAVHREQLLAACRACPEEHILVTHGTDTMAETALWLKGHLPNKTIVLTGAMIPIAFGSSDGLFNLGGALAFLQTLPPGTWIAMNGRYFAAGKVRKNRRTGIFEEQS
jgi:L-asparaginase